MRLCLIFYLCLCIWFKKEVLCDEKIDSLRQKNFPSCKACRIYVASFNKGIERTSKGKYEGGDTSWEEKKLGSYAQSEIRLTEIQEGICSDVEEGKNQCYKLNEEYDHLVEEWWFNYQNSQPDLFQHLCVDQLKVCCLDLHYGPDCLPCSGFPNKVCSNNGKCVGAGTRKGSGKCTCDIGYVGETCDHCASRYYEAYKDDMKLLCSKCHISCDSECTKGGPAGCINCSSGWQMEAEKGCVDINECTSSAPVCSPLEFCVNSEGSYKCLKCDTSCYGCTGDGPDMCINCASGYTFVDNICIDSATEDRKQHVFLMRYLTYLGLVIATCIIFQRSITLAALIGTCVAVYIGVSEYMLNTLPSIVNIDSIQKLLRNDL